jgi:hypothetical protein
MNFMSMFLFSSEATRIALELSDRISTWLGGDIGISLAFVCSVDRRPCGAPDMIDKDETMLTAIDVVADNEGNTDFVAQCVPENLNGPNSGMALPVGPPARRSSTSPAPGERLRSSRVALRSRPQSRNCRRAVGN